jgi:hypothetical protein
VSYVEPVRQGVHTVEWRTTAPRPPAQAQVVP